jgi:tetratricopeptide (TPR) repeat protein
LAVQVPSYPSASVRQLYVEGRFFWNKRTEAGLLRSIQCFQQATLKDPQYAVAYAGLADSYALLASYGVESAQQAHPIAKAAALRALALDPSLAEANTSLGMIFFFYEWNWRKAEQQFQRSLTLDPKYPFAHTWYAVGLAANNRCEEGIAHVQIARELDDLSLIINTEVGRVYYLCRQYNKAIDAFRRAIDLDPHFARAHSRLGMTYAAQHDFRQAICEFNKAEQLTGNDPYLDGLLGYCHASIGEDIVARDILNKLLQERQDRFVPAYSIALICVGLLDHERAMEWLTRAYEDRSTYLVFAKTDPLLDPVHSDEAFVSLLKLMEA